MFHNRPYILTVALIVGLLLLMVFSISSGAMSVPLSQLFSILMDPAGTGGNSSTETQHLVIWQIRLPRVVLTVLVGASLALSGAMVQGLFRNPLADPSLIGVSGGAAVGAACAIVLGGGWQLAEASWAVPMAAFVGGAMVTALVYYLGVGPMGTSVATMLLAGVAINAMTGACISYLSTVAEDVRLRNLVFWMMGSFNVSTWNKVLWVFPFLLVALLVMTQVWKGLNALLLGESEARHLGIPVERLRLWVILTAALAVGVSVAAVGMIGFVGLVVPHLIRLLIGPDHRWLLPASALLGAVLLCAADWAARTWLQPKELPIGVLTAALGAPFFLFLVSQRRRGNFYGS